MSSGFKCSIGRTSGEIKPDRDFFCEKLWKVLRVKFGHKKSRSGKSGTAMGNLSKSELNQ